MKNKILIILFIILVIIITFLWIALTNDNQFNEKTEIKLSKTDVNQITIKANKFFTNKAYELAKDKYEILIDNWEYSPVILSNLFVCYIYSWEYSKWLNIIRMLEIISWNTNLTKWPIIEKNNLSEKINELVLKIAETEQKDPALLLDYAKLLYKAWDYYYELDQQKHYLVIMTHYLTAFIVLDQAIKLNPNDWDYYFYQWWLHMDIWERFDLSEEKLEKAITLKQDDFRYYYRLWNAYLHQWKYEEAIEVFTKWIKLNNNYEKLYLNLWLSYSNVGNINKSLFNYNKWLEICFEQCDSFYNNMWSVRAKQWKTDEAIDLFKKAFELNPDNKKAYKNYLKYKNNQ